MKFKKTFWMNVISAIVWTGLSWVMLSIYSSEHGLENNFDVVVLQYFCIVAAPVVTALAIYYTNKKSLRNLALFANYAALVCCVLISILYFYMNPNILLSWDLLAIPFTFLIFGLPAVINLKTLKKVQ
jgi:uncharacterized membrane protein YvlD (DUF360 family)